MYISSIYKMLFCMNGEFRGLTLQTHFSQNVIFIGCNTFPQVMDIFLHLLNIFHQVLTSINDVSNLA